MHRIALHSLLSASAEVPLRRIGLPMRHVKELLRGTRITTPETALRLARGLRHPCAVLVDVAGAGCVGKRG